MERLNVIPIIKEDRHSSETGTRGQSSTWVRSSSDDTALAFQDASRGSGIAGIRKQFTAFDAKKAKCFRPEDCGRGGRTKLSLARVSVWAAHWRLPSCKLAAHVVPRSCCSGPREAPCCDRIRLRFVGCFQYVGLGAIRPAA